MPQASISSAALSDIEQAPAPSPVCCDCRRPVAPAETPPASRMQAGVKWFANLSALGGGAAMAGFPAICLSAWSYVPFFVSHIIWTVFAWRLKEKELTYLNLGALGLDVWAIVTRVL